MPFPGIVILRAVYALLHDGAVFDEEKFAAV